MGAYYKCRGSVGEELVGYCRRTVTHNIFKLIDSASAQDCGVLSKKFQILRGL